MTLDRAKYRRRNRLKMIRDRLRYPPPIYKKSGGIDVVVNHADGTKTDLGKVAVTYSKRWGAGTGT